MTTPLSISDTIAILNIIMHFTPWKFTKARDIVFDNRAIIYDSEFVREKNYYPRLALVQINQAHWGEAALIDILNDDCRSFWTKICQHQSPIVMHAAAQDIEMIQLVSQSRPQSLRDTQIGYALFNPNPSISYADMVQDLLEITIDKSETRSDWLSRPLTQMQCDYAADDVGPLLACYWHICSRLNQLNRLHWWSEECTRFLNEQSQKSQDYPWYKLRGASQKLRKKHIALAQLLTNHREKLAESADLPRRKILSDEAIINGALAGLSTADDLATFFANKEAFLLDFEELVSGLENIETLQVPIRERAQSLSYDQQKQLEILISHTEKTAAELNLSPDTLASPKELKTWISCGFNHVDKLKGWRGEFYQSFID